MRCYKKENSLLIARDRMGINPLLVYHDKDKLIFSSEMKAILSYDIPKEIDYISVANYLQFNYIPAPHSIFKNVSKLTPGTYLFIKENKIEKKQYYKIPNPSQKRVFNSYEEAQKELYSLLDNSVQKRLISDIHKL